MKKQIIGGISIALLAAGAAFASVSSVPQDVFYWQNEETEQNCTPVRLNTICVDEPGECREPTPAGNRQIYSDSNCQEPMQKNTGF